MKITICNKEYDFEINGTVGLVYLAQRILGDPKRDGEEFDGNNPYHQVVLYYSAFHSSNKNVKNLPDLQTFMSSLTAKMMKELSTYFWQRWNELEGNVKNENEDENENKPGED